ncbi:MAG: HNH endonuclease [Patescibacteria group bacterium]|nr:HNH endonuclease [Patescibacteria group bacterium]
MPIVKCKICGKNFHIKPSHKKLGYGKYCSKKCQYQGQRKGKYVICEICGKEVWKMPKELRASKSQKFFCSKRCQTIWRNKYYIGELHSNWRGGEFIYYRIMRENKIFPRCKICGIKDKRVLIIHHKDSDRKNYKIDNLVWLCRNCHYLVHNKDVRVK